MGYRIVIEEGLTQEQLLCAESFVNAFIDYTKLNKGSWKGLSRGGWCNGRPLRRGVYGSTWGGLLEAGLVFRRMSRGRRIFGVIKIKHLVDLDGNIGEEIGKGMCKCHRHAGGIRVNLRTQPEVNTYYETGNIKG